MIKLLPLLIETGDPSRAGRCYELAAKHAMKHGGTYTIAKVVSQGKRMNHAFVINGDKIYDPEYDKYFPRLAYLKSLHVNNFALQIDGPEGVSIWVLKNKTWPYPEKFNIH